MYEYQVIDVEYDTDPYKLDHALNEMARAGFKLSQVLGPTTDRTAAGPRTYVRVVVEREKE